MNKSSLLINEPPLQVLPSLAVAIGLNEAIVIQQLHYWLNNPKTGVDRDGYKWIFNTYQEWQENFPFWSTSTIQRIFSTLEESGLIISEQLDKKSHDMTKFYRLNYDKLCEMHRVKLESSRMSERHDVNSITETTTENNGFSLTAEELNQANAMVDAIIANSGRVDTWEGREIFAPQTYALVDWYHSVTGQTCPKSKRKDWMRAVTMWQANQLTVDHLQAAYDMDVKWRGVFTSPNQLTEKAIALKAQRQVKPVEMVEYL